MSDSLDKILESLIFEANLDRDYLANIPIQINKAKAALLKWHAEAVVGELKKLLLTTKCDRLDCKTNHQIKLSTIKDCIKQLEGAE